MMNILMINYSEITSPGGVHTTIREIAKRLSKKGHNITVVQGNQLNLPSNEVYEGFKIIRVKSRFADFFYGVSPAIYFYLKKDYYNLNPNIIHIHGYHTLLTFEIISLIKKLDPDIPIVFSPHFGVFSRSSFAGKYLWNFYNKFIGKNIIKKSDIIITASEYEFGSLVKTLNVPENMIKTIPHGVGFYKFKTQRNVKDIINLLYVGNLIELKGVQFIIKAMSFLINNKEVNISLTVVGEGPYKKNLKELAKSLNVNDFIRWEGVISHSNTEELLEYYNKADIVLLLSKSENYGIVVAESLSTGTPVIVTKRTALKEFLDENGCFGVDYPPDPEEIGNLILKIFHSQITIDKLSPKIGTWDEVSEEYTMLYNNLVFK